MSFDINWENLCDDSGLQDGFRDFLNDKLSSMDMPDYLDNLQVVSFELGSVSPELAIRDIDFPFPEFYGMSDASVIHMSRGTSAGNTRDASPEADDANRKRSATRLNSPLPPAASMMIPNQSSPYFQGVHNGVGIAAFGRNNEIDSSDEESTFAAVPMEPNLSIDGVHEPDSAAVGRNPPMKSMSEVLSEPSTPPTSEELEDTPVSGEATPGDEGILPQGENDVQMTLDLKWNSKIYIEVTCSLAVNYPSKDFISLPVRFKISDLSIHSLAVVAYLDEKIFVSFLCDIDDYADVSKTKDTTGGFLSQSGRSESRDRIDIIKDLKIEGQLGDYIENVDALGQSKLPFLSPAKKQSLGQLGTTMTTSDSGTIAEASGNGSVLRNIGKIEKFIVGTLRTILVNELAWPSWVEVDMHDYSKDPPDSENSETPAPSEE